MKCPMCGGIGLTDLHTPNVGRCIKCNGSGEIEPTNEEWLHSLNTEQLADVLNKMTLSCYICGQDGYNENPRHCIFGRCTGKEDILEWLKEPHKE